MLTSRLLLAAALTALLAASAGAQSSDANLDAGFAALQAGDTEKAATAFRRALAEDPRDPVALYGAAAAAHLQRRDADAVRWLKEALQIEPRLTHASALLGDIVYHQGDLAYAIKLYEAALAHSPGDVFLRERLASWRSEAAVHHDLQAFRYDRFTILFNGRADRALAERAAAVLDGAFWRIARTLGSSPSNPINVIFYTDRQFRDITGAPEWAGAGFDGQIRMPVGGVARNLQQFDGVLTHELTHAMLSAIAMRNVPAWLNEGLAMYFEGDDPAAARRRLAAAGVFVPLRNLERGFTGLSAVQATVAYDMSAVATSALITRIGVDNVGFLLQDLDRGQTVDVAVQRFGFTFAQFEAELAKRIGAR